MTPLAVTGVGAVTPFGDGPSPLLTALDAGRCCLGPACCASPEAAGGGWAGRIDDFDPTPYIAPMRARRLDRASLFAVAAARQALAAAGLSDAADLGDGLGVLVGTSSAGSGPLTAFLDALFRQSPEVAPPFEFPNTVANAPASHVSIELGLRGPNATLSHSEAVAASTLVYGRLLLADRRCSMLLVGAVDEWGPYHQAAYRQLGALREAPRGGGGMVLTEGAVMMVVEEEERARRRGATILSRVVGEAAGSAAGEPYRWVADAPALARVVGEALERSQRPPAALGSVFLAANGVAAMEEAEAEALAEVFAGRPAPLAASGVKGALGERAVSGAAAVAVAALARHRGLLPPFAGGAREAWPAPLAPLTDPSPLPPGATLVVLYGFGGNYGAVVLD